jgi:hypothetical protein
MTSQLRGISAALSAAALAGECREIEGLGKNVVALIRIADPRFSKIGSNYEVRTGAEGGAQRSKEADKQGPHRVIMRDGETCRPGRLSIVSTVVKYMPRMTSWRRTGSRGSRYLGRRR